MPLRRKPTNLNAARNYPFLKQTGVLQSDSVEQIGHDMDNNSYLSFASPDGLSAIEALRVDASSRLSLGQTIKKNVPKVVRWTMAANASIADQCFFIADQAYEFVAAFEVHSTAASDSGAVTLDITKDASGVAPTAGTSLLASQLSMKSTANVYQVGLPGTTAQTISIAAGDRLSVNFTGTLTALAGVEVVVFLAPGYSGDSVSFVMNANAGLLDQCFFIANQTMKITGINYVHAVAGTDASAVNVQVTKDVSTDAPGAGTNLLTNNSNNGFNCKATANVVQAGALSATAADLILSAGDRLSVDFAGTVTTLAGVVIVVTFEPYYKTLNLAWNMNANGSLADQAVFVANRPYEIIYVSEVHATAGTDASAVSMQIKVDRAAVAPAAGSAILSNNANAGFNLKSTANTVQNGTFTLGTNYMSIGDRLSVDFVGVLTTLAGVAVTVTLREA